MKQVYKTIYKDIAVELFMIDVGASMSVGMLEEKDGIAMIALELATRIS